MGCYRLFLLGEFSASQRKKKTADRRCVECASNRDATRKERDRGPDLAPTPKSRTRDREPTGQEGETTKGIDHTIYWGGQARTWLSQDTGSRPADQKAQTPTGSGHGLEASASDPLTADRSRRSPAPGFRVQITVKIYRFEPIRDQLCGPEPQPVYDKMEGILRRARSHGRLA